MTLPFKLNDWAKLWYFGQLPIAFSHPEVGCLVLQPVTVLFAYDQLFSMRILLPSPEADTAAKLLRLMSTREVQENHMEKD